MNRKRLCIILPKCPQWETVVFIAIFTISLALFYYTFNYRTEEMTEGQSKIIIPAALTLFVTSLLKLLPVAVATIANRTTKGKLAIFFGKCILSDNIRYVFSERLLKDDYNKEKVWNLNYKSLTGKDNYEPLPEGVKAWIPFQDIRAAVYISTIVTRYADVPPRFILDKEICSMPFDNIDHTAIAIGLGFNTFTHLLARFTDYKLFKIKFGPFPSSNDAEHEDISTGIVAPKETFDKTGQNTINNKTAETDFIVFEEKTLVHKDDYKDYSLVARIIPPQSPRKPSHYFFICAGRTASGTAAAGHYLKHNWLEMYKLYKKSGKNIETDSLSVIIEHKIDRHGLFDIDSDEKIALDHDGQKMYIFYTQN